MGLEQELQRYNAARAARVRLTAPETAEARRVRELRAELEAHEALLARADVYVLDVVQVADALARKAAIEHMLVGVEAKVREREQSDREFQERSAATAAREREEREQEERQLSELRERVASDPELRRVVETRNISDRGRAGRGEAQPDLGPLPGGVSDTLRRKLYGFRA